MIRIDTTGLTREMSLLAAPIFIFSGFLPEMKRRGMPDAFFTMIPIDELAGKMPFRVPGPVSSFPCVPGSQELSRNYPRNRG